MIQTRKVDTKGRVILPDYFAGRVVTVDLVNESEVRIRLARVPRVRPALGTLLSRITKANLPEKIDFGFPAGGEQL